MDRSFLAFFHAALDEQHPVPPTAPGGPSDNGHDPQEGDDDADGVSDPSDPPLSQAPRVEPPQTEPPAKRFA